MHAETKQVRPGQRKTRPEVDKLRYGTRPEGDKRE